MRKPLSADAARGQVKRADGTALPAGLVHAAAQHEQAERQHDRGTGGGDIGRLRVADIQPRVAEPLCEPAVPKRAGWRR